MAVCNSNDAGACVDELFRGFMISPVMFAHGEGLIAGLTTLFVAGVSFVACFCVCLRLYLSDRTKKRRVLIVALLWPVLVVITAIVAGQLFGVP